MTNSLMKLMYPKGHLIHYAKWGSGFQTLELLCDRKTELGKVNLNFDDWASMTPTCKKCLEKRHEYAYIERINNHESGITESSKEKAR